MDDGFADFLAQATAIGGPDVCHNSLSEIWERQGRNLDAALGQFMESRSARTGPHSGGRRSSSRSSLRSRGSDSGQSDAGKRDTSRSEPGKHYLDVAAAAGKREPCDIGKGSASVAVRKFLATPELNATHDVQTPVEAASAPAAAESLGENITVLARFRPMNEQEIESQGERECVEFSEDGRSCVLAIEQPKAEVEFTFSRVFQPMSSQEDIYEVVSPTISSVINGINSSIIAYGQTGSGKTHTMMGPNGAKALIDGQFDDPERGLIPRALLELQTHAWQSEGAVTLRVSYIEIYQEKVRDLLKVVKSAEGGPHGQRIDGITEDKEKGLFLPDVVDMPVGSAKEAMEIMQKGNKFRTKAATKMNEDSSRSHAIFVISVANNTDPANRKIAQLYLVDLAGSERADKTGVWGKQLDEAKLINKSLLALGQVIVSLSEKSSHVPYRDSKLTRILQNALGGNSRTALICAVSPHPDNANESLSTLRFGSRASRIRNEARMNIVLDPKELKKQLDKARSDIEELKREKAELKRENEALRQERQAEHSVAERPQIRTCAPVDAAKAQKSSGPAALLHAAPRRPEVPDQLARSVLELNASSERAGSAPAISPNPPPASKPPSAIPPARVAATPPARVAAAIGAASPVDLEELVAQQLFTRQLMPSLLCPVTGAVMREPVCATDGASYERSAIERLMKQAGRMPAMSPVTGRSFPSKQVVPNAVLQQIISVQLPNLPPLEARISDFARVSCYLLDHILTFCNGRTLGQSQKVCKDFYAVGCAPRLWDALLRNEFGDAGGQEEARQRYGARAVRPRRNAPLPSCGLRLVGLS